jgi:hypothetical protein
MKRLPCLLVAGGLLLALPLAAHADYLGGIRYSQHNPSSLPFTENVVVSIDYKVTEPGGGVIFARPYTNGALTPNYTASGGSVVSAGTGTVTQTFHITSGERVVDHIRAYLKSPDLSETWLEVFLPVSFTYGPSAVLHMDFSHTRYSVLKYGQQFSATFDYHAADPLGCRVYMRPYTNGALTPGYSASGSAVLPQAGSTTQWFSFAGDADVTDLHFTVNDHNNVTIFEHDIPYPLHWRSVGLYNISFDWPPETSLQNTQNLTTSFTLDHDVAGGLRVWARPMIGGSYPPQFAWQPSGLEPAGANALSRFCRVSAGEQDIDGIQLQVATNTEVVLEFIVPADLHWATHAIQNPVFVPAAPAILSNGEFLGATVDYLTSATGNVRLFDLPALDYQLLPGSPTYTTTIYPAPSGTASCYCTFSSGDHVADSMRFRMTSSDWSQVLLTHFYHGHWAWGSSAVITPVPEAGVAAAAQLGTCYPNPFNPAVTIPVILANDAAVCLAVFDTRGRLVQTLVDGTLTAGRHEIRFDGSGLPSGTYFCRLDGPGGAQTRRMTLVK